MEEAGRSEAMAQGHLQGGRSSAESLMVNFTYLKSASSLSNPFSGTDAVPCHGEVGHLVAWI